MVRNLLLLKKCQQQSVNTNVNDIFTGIRLFDPSLESIQNFIKGVNEKVAELSEGQLNNAVEEDGLLLSLALVYDAAVLYTSALSALGLEEGSNITCEDDESWNFGSTVINYIRTVSVVIIICLPHSSSTGLTPSSGCKNLSS